MNKRDFFKNLSALSISAPLSLPAILEILQSEKSTPISTLAKNDDFWLKIRGDYRLKPDYINLENGYYSFLPEPTLNKYIENIREINYQNSYYMRTVQWENQKKTAARLAEVAGCSADELIITRNTTESLDMVIAGQNWQAGDEAVMAEQDYGAMLNQFKMMERRYGIINKVVSVPNHPQSDDEIVDLYSSAITNKTKLLMICHMINITGQVLPVRKICDMAHERGVEVMVDGAHAFAQLDFKLDDLNCDYYGTSLHKWLSVPLGAGFLYVKKGSAGNIWPLMAESDLPDDDIARLNHTGTHPVHTHLTINDAIDYHQAIGVERKQARLKYLQNYWTSNLRQVDKLIVNTPADIDRHGAIGNIGVEGMEPKELSKKLLDEFKIWTVAINRPGVRGVRITPNLYTTTKELDIFIESMKSIAAG